MLNKAKRLELATRIKLGERISPDTAAKYPNHMGFGFGDWCRWPAVGEEEDPNRCLVVLDTEIKARRADTSLGAPHILEDGTRVRCGFAFYDDLMNWLQGTQIVRNGGRPSA